MKIEKKEIDSLNAKMVVKIEPADYEQKYKSSLQDYRKKTNIKGFRKGKTPLGFIKKLYGKAILADVVNDTLQQAVVNYLTEEKIDFLGQPLPAEDQQPIDFESGDGEDFEFIFDLGLAPDFDLKLDEGKKFTRYKVEIPDKIVRDEIDLMRRRMGSQDLATEDIQEKDILLLSAKELQEGQVKEESHENEFTIMVELIADEKLKKEVLKKKVGDTFRFDIYSLEKDRDEKYVRKYFLGLGDDEEKEVGNEFEAEIKEVRRIMPAELNEEFFNQAFGNKDIQSEADAMDAIRKDISAHYEKQEDAILYKEIQNFLMSAHSLDLPDSFLRRWLAFNDENVSEGEIEENFEGFQKDLSWRLIKNKVAQKFGIKVEESEIVEEAQRRIKSYLGAYQDAALIQSLQQRILGDRQQVEKIAEEIEANKMFATLVEQYETKEKKISLDDFRDKVNELSGKEG